MESLHANVKVYRVNVINRDYSMESALAIFIHELRYIKKKKDWVFWYIATNE